MCVSYLKLPVHEISCGYSGSVLFVNRGNEVGGVVTSSFPYLLRSWAMEVHPSAHKAACQSRSPRRCGTYICRTDCVVFLASSSSRGLQWAEDTILRSPSSGGGCTWARNFHLPCADLQGERSCARHDVDALQRSIRVRLEVWLLSEPRFFSKERRYILCMVSPQACEG